MRLSPGEVRFRTTEVVVRPSEAGLPPAGARLPAGLDPLRREGTELV